MILLHYLLSGQGNWEGTMVCINGNGGKIYLISISQNELEMEVLIKQTENICSEEQMNTDST